MAPVPADDDAMLLDRARKGDRGAFCGLVRLYQSDVRFFLGCHARPADVVDDLAHDVFLRAYRNMGRYRGESSFRMWLIGIARNRVLEHLRETLRYPERRPMQMQLAAWQLEILAAGTDEREHRLVDLE